MTDEERQLRHAYHGHETHLSHLNIKLFLYRVTFQLHRWGLHLSVGRYDPVTLARCTVHVAFARQGEILVT